MSGLVRCGHFLSGQVGWRQDLSDLDRCWKKLMFLSNMNKFNLVWSDVETFCLVWLYVDNIFLIGTDVDMFFLLFWSDVEKLCLVWSYVHMFDLN